MPDDLTAWHLASKEGYEEQRGNNGLLTIHGLEGIETENNILVLSLQGFPLPKVNVDPLETGYLNEKRKFAGAVSQEFGDITFKDFVDKQTAHTLKKWHEKVYDPVTGKVGLAKDYKKDAIIEIFAPDGSYSRYYYLSGIWPNNFDPGAIDMDTVDPIRITITFSIDKWYVGDKDGGSVDDGGLIGKAATA